MAGRGRGLQVEMGVVCQGHLFGARGCACARQAAVPSVCDAGDQAMVDEQGVERGGGVMKVEGRREKGEGAYTLPDYSLIPVPADPPRIRDGRRKRKRFSAGGKFMAKYEAQQGICAICHEDRKST